MIAGTKWRVFLGAFGAVFALAAAVTLVTGPDREQLAVALLILPFAASFIIVAAAPVARAGALGTVRSGACDIRGTTIQALLLVPAPRRLALTAAAITGFAISWTGLLVALLGESVIGALVIGWPGPLALAFVPLLWRRVARPQLAAVVLTTDGLSLDGGKGWANWEDVRWASVVDQGRGSRVLQLGTTGSKRPGQLGLGGTDVDLHVLAGLITRLRDDPQARELLPTATEATVRLLAGG